MGTDNHPSHRPFHIINIQAHIRIAVVSAIRIWALYYRFLIVLALLLFLSCFMQGCLLTFSHNTAVKVRESKSALTLFSSFKFSYNIQFSQLTPINFCIIIPIYCLQLFCGILAA